MIISDDPWLAMFHNNTKDVCEKGRRRCWVLTEASVTGELLVDLFHPLNVEAAGLCVVHHGLGVMHSNNAFGCFLHALRSVPGIVNILGWEPSQNGQVAPE